MTVAGARADTGAAVDTTHSTSVRPAGDGGPSLPRRLLSLADRHPLWTVVLLAALARAVAVVLLGPLRPGVAVPDEQQYLDLAASVASGRGAEAWQPGYGQSLYDSTAAFMRPLTFLVRVFGEHQVVGQLLSAAFGVLAAVLTTWLALRVVRTRYAWLVGGIVALMPSQVFWSSVVLRESMVWAALAGVALAVALATSSRSWSVLGGSAALAVLSLWALSDVRGQTAVVVSGSLVLVALVVRSARRVVVPVTAVLIAILVPWGAGLGPAGLFYVANVVPQLATIRTNLSIGADSSFIDRTVIPPGEAPGAGTGADGQDGKGEDGDGQDGETPADAPPDAAVVTDSTGTTYVVEDTPAASVSAIPRGLVAVALRPFPWEPARNTGLLVAKVENLAWGLLYVLAVIGAIAGWGRRRALAFPVIVTGAIVLSAAVSQANLGTAFRHRGQILWALAVLAVVGLQHLVDRRRAARG